MRAGPANAPADAFPRAPADGPPDAVHARLRVVLRLPEAWLAPGVVVYALPAGAPGVEQHVDIPHGKPDRKTPDTVELLLPSPGPWDVGVRCMYGHVLEEDVLASEREEVVLRAPRTASISFRYVGTRDTATLASFGFSLRSLADQDDRTVRLPGRGQVSPIRFGLRLDERGEARTPPLPADRTFRVRTPHPPARPVGVPLETRELRAPDRPVRAGETVTLVEVGLVPVHLSLRLLDPVPDAWMTMAARKLRTWTAIRAEPERAPASEHRYANTLLQEDGTLKDPELVMLLPPGRYVLRSGIGKAYIERTRMLTVTDDPTQRIEIGLRPDPQFVPGGRPTPGEAFLHDTSVRVRGVSPGRRVPLLLETWHGEAWGIENHGGVASADGTALAVQSHARHRRAWAFAFPDRASRAFELPAHGEATVTVEPAGLLVLVPDRSVPGRLGTLALRRPDGDWFPVVEGELSGDDWLAGTADVTMKRSVVVTPRTVVGPLLHGAHTFDVVLGGALLRRVEARVRAGRLTPLSIPVSAGRARGD